MSSMSSERPCLKGAGSGNGESHLTPGTHRGKSWKLDIVTYACHPSTQEVRQQGREFKIILAYNREFKARLRDCLKKTQESKERDKKKTKTMGQTGPRAVLWGLLKQR